MNHKVVVRVVGFATGVVMCQVMIDGKPVDTIALSSGDEVTVNLIEEDVMIPQGVTLQ